VDEKELAESEVEESDIVDINGNTLTNTRGESVYIHNENFNNWENEEPTIIFFFCAPGVINQDGLISSIHVLSTGQEQSASSFSLPTLPSSFSNGGEVSAAYTDGAITACTTGTTLLSPYGFVFGPGYCIRHHIRSAGWEQRGGRMAVGGAGRNWSLYDLLNKVSFSCITINFCPNIRLAL
jgi:hypothetical protein